MPGNFVFDEIPVDWLLPGTYLEIRPNYAQMGILPYPVQNLVIGQILPAGTLKPGDIVQVVRAEDGEALFGKGSVGAEQVKAFRAANSTQPLFVMGLKDADDAIAASGKVTFTGSIAADTLLRFLIAGQEIRIYASASETVTQLASNLALTINGTETLPVTAEAASGTVTITGKHKGEVGNEIDIRVNTKEQPLPAGLTVEITAMTGGAGNPDLRAALDKISTTWFTAITHPWSDSANMKKFADFLDKQYEAMTARDAHGFVAKRGTFSDAITFGNLTNCAFLTCLVLNRSPTSSWIISAAAMGIAAFHLTNDPARQLRSLVLPAVSAPDPADRFIDIENEALLRAGISSLACLADGSVTISRMITTYKMSNGISDRAWMDIMTPATMSRIRYDWSAYITLQYPRSKLADDDSLAAEAATVDENGDIGNAVVTPGRMKASWAGRCLLYAANGWIEDTDKTIRDSVFQRSPTDKNRLESRQHIRVIGNLMVLAGSLEFRV